MSEIRTHFEIGIDDGTETRSVFQHDNLSACLEEWKEQEYKNENGYFIDVWETKEGDVPYPIATIKQYSGKLKS